jgi:type I restriction enzyme S subunit
LKNSSAELLPAGSLIVCTRATVGGCCINSVPMATNQGFKSLAPKADAEIRYVYHTVNARQRELIRLANGSTFLEVSKPDFENLQIAVPSLGQQRLIADALDTEATEIALLQEGVERLEAQKRALMQKLLTGEWRLDARFDPPAPKPQSAIVRRAL